MIKIVDTVTDKALNVHEGNESKMNDNKNTSVDELHVEVKRDEVSSLNKELLHKHKIV